MLKLDAKNLVKLNDAVGLHPAMKPLDALLQAGHLAVCPGVGYPNPFRSHFEGIAVWHAARLETEARIDKEARAGYGWLGQAMDPSKSNLFFIGGGSDMPMALRGRRSCAVSFNKLDDVLISNPLAIKAGLGPESSDNLLAFIRRQEIDALATADQLAKLSSFKGGPAYPPTALASQLKLVAQLMKGDMGARVFYTRQDSYDTHGGQLLKHSSLLGELAGAVAAFFADLKEAKIMDRVVLITFSEFGRTLSENVSEGTDHGTAGAMFVVGSTVKGGLVGTMPSLSELIAGEPVMTTDFRTIYAAVLENWLGVAAENVLDGKFKAFSLFN
jgi:uncharacterized protein (DUF1501 family)